MKEEKLFWRKWNTGIWKGWGNEKQGILVTLGNMRIPISPLSATKVYVSMPLIRMLLEVNDYSSKPITYMDDTHWEVANSIQGLNQSTPTVSVLPSINWVSIENTIPMFI